MKRYILVHYGELGLKKSNKPYFVGKLRDAIRKRLQERFKISFRIRHSLSRFFIPIEDDFIEAEYVDILSKIPGIKNFSFVYEAPVDLERIGKRAWSVFEGLDFDTYLGSPRNFRVKCKRSMLLPFKSPEAEREIGAQFLKRGLDLPVKLKGAEFIFWVEFVNDHAYFAFKRYQGLAGLPSNSQGKMVALLSSGIDSPVAAFSMMRRGVRVIFVNFHAYPYSDASERDQVRDIFDVLSQYQFSSKLYSVPFADAQRAIATTVEIPAKWRTLLYRRMMLRIAQEIARKEQAKGLITGDSLGQVASQTPENLFAIHDASSIPLFQPLIAMDKEDVIKVAEKIDTYKISKLPCKDSCTMFTPKKPELKGNIFDLRECEKLFDVDYWVEESLSNSEIISA